MMLGYFAALLKLVTYTHLNTINLRRVMHLSGKKPVIYVEGRESAGIARQHCWKGGLF